MNKDSKPHSDPLRGDTRLWFSPHGTEWEAETYEEALEMERDSLVEQLEAAQRVVENYHAITREREALARQIAHEWGWPDAASVLTRLRGDRTAALITFTEEAVAAYLDVPHNTGKEPHAD